jgi:hypothetical protein
MKSFKILIVLFIFNTTSSIAQFGLTPAQRDSINKLTEADYNNMLGQLSINRSQVRRGPSRRWASPATS